MKKSMTEFVREEFKKEGYKPLTEEYINARDKLDSVSITWTKYQKESAVEFIRSTFAEEGCILLTIEYKNDQQKLDYICPNGHRHSITLADWQQGCRCFFCTIMGKFKRR